MRDTRRATAGTALMDQRNALAQRRIQDELGGARFDLLLDAVFEAQCDPVYAGNRRWLTLGHRQPSPRLAGVAPRGRLLDAAIEPRGQLAPHDRGLIKRAQGLLVPAVAFVKALHRLAREQVVVVEILQRQWFEEMLVKIVGF